MCMRGRPSCSAWILSLFSNASSHDPTKLCYMFGRGPDMKMVVQTLKDSPPLTVKVTDRLHNDLAISLVTAATARNSTKLCLNFLCRSYSKMGVKKLWVLSVKRGAQNACFLALLRRHISAVIFGTRNCYRHSSKIW